MESIYWDIGMLSLKMEKNQKHFAQVQNFKMQL